MSEKLTRADTLLLILVLFLAVAAANWLFGGEKKTTSHQAAQTAQAPAPSPQPDPDKERKEAGAKLFRSLADKGASQSLYGHMVSPKWVLFIPQAEWDKLTMKQREDLGFYASSMAMFVRSAPDAYVGIPATAPAYEMIKRKIATMDEGNWAINTTKKGKRGEEVGPFVLAGDSAWYSLEGSKAAKWSDYREGKKTTESPPPAAPPPVPSQQDAQTMAEIRSRRWLLNYAHDADSVFIEDRGPFFRSQKGYVQKVKVRAKNAMGAKVLNVFEFHFDERGNVVDVKQ